MKVLTPKAEFHVKRECDCGAVFEVTRTDLRCERYATDYGDWYPIFVNCPECGAWRDMIHLTPEYITEELRAERRHTEQQHAPWWRRWLSRLLG